MRTVKLIVFLTAVVAAFSAAAFAEDQPQTAHRLDEVFVTATKYETSTKEVPASVTVIKREDLEAQNFPNNDVADALRSVAGITLRRAYAPFPAYLNIRGGTSDGTVVLVNGVPTNWEISQAIPVDNIERVEILRGPASALYGANAIGGVVNIITKEGGEKFEATRHGRIWKLQHRARVTARQAGAPVIFIMPRRLTKRNPTARTSWKTT